MSDSSYQCLNSIFHPRAIAIAGITIANPEHWTRTFLEALISMNFEGQLYLVNRRGGEIGERKVYQSLTEIPDTIDYVIGTVSAKAAPALVEECASKGVKTIHFCTSGFSETGEEEGIRLEAEITKLARKTGIRVIGPNCMGIYCPESRLSFNPWFPKESGPVGFISQSGANAGLLAANSMWRGVRFSKIISFGNACDLNESDFLEYLAEDPDTRIIAMYLEGVKDGKRFLRALEKAARKKPVILLKGGVTRGGAQATLGHTGALAGDETTWDALCRQFGVIRVNSLDELADVLVTLLFLPLSKGRNAILLGAGGGASVMITDTFEKNGLIVPPLPQKVRDQIRSFTPIAGNILRNPIDYSQTMLEVDKLVETAKIATQWEGSDFLTIFFAAAQFAWGMEDKVLQMVDGVFKAARLNSKPTAAVMVPGIVPELAAQTFPIIQKIVSIGIPVYYSFDGAAKAIDLVLSYHEHQHKS